MSWAGWMLTHLIIYNISQAIFFSFQQEIYSRTFSWLQKINELKELVKVQKRKRSESGHNGVITANYQQWRWFVQQHVPHRLQPEFFGAFAVALRRGKFSKSDKKPLGVSTVKETVENWVKTLGQSGAQPHQLLADGKLSSMWWWVVFLCQLMYVWWISTIT